MTTKDIRYGLGQIVSSDGSIALMTANRLLRSACGASYWLLRRRGCGSAFLTGPSPPWRVQLEDVATTPTTGAPPRWPSGAPA